MTSSDYLWQRHEWRPYLACDPHPVTAHAFVWLIVNEDGKMIVPWSWWPNEENERRANSGQPRLEVADYINGVYIVEQMRIFAPADVELMDQAGKGMKAGEGIDYFQKYRDPKSPRTIRRIRFSEARRNNFSGKDKDYHGYAEITEALREGTLTIADHVLGHVAGDNALLLGQLERLRRKEVKGVAAEERDRPDEPANKERHLIDCLSYILMDKPKFVPPRNPNRDPGSLPPSLRVGPGR